MQFTIQGENSKIEFQQSEVRQNGAISFETPETQQFLRGKPIEVQSTPHKFTGLWRQDKRLITVSFEKDSIGIIFSLSADPSTDIVKWKINIAASEDEYFTGLFERTVDGSQKESWKQGITEAMNLRGQQVDMLIKPTLSLYCPFYISSKGYALFITGTWPGVYDFCKTDSNLVKIEFEGSSMRGKIYSSNNPADIVKAHSLNVGPTILPPKWAFLPWRWRDQHVNLKTYYNNTPVKSPYNSQVVEDILMMKAFDIPCGVYWIDRPWAKGKMGYENFEWDNERFPHAVEMIDWIHENDMRFLLWIAPWVVGDMKTTAEQNGYNQPMKYAPWGVDTTTAALLDFTNPKACRWWQKEGIEKMLRQGVDGFKLDRSEEIVPETNDIILSDGRTAREVRNAYPVMYVRTVNESCKKIKGNDFILIPRAAYTGSSKYSGFWGGDIGSPPEGLRAAIIALLRSAIIGYPIWGSDIGGYWQGDLNREVCAPLVGFWMF